MEVALRSHEDDLRPQYLFEFFCNRLCTTHTYIVALLEERCMYDSNSYHTQFVTLNMAADISYSGMMLMIVATMFMMMIMIVMLLLRRSTRTRVRLRVSMRMRMRMMMMMAIMIMLMLGIRIMMMMTVAQ